MPPAKDRLPRRHEFLVSPNDYLNDPNVLGKSTEFRGVYSTLWLNSWNMPEPGVIPADACVLRGLARATLDEWDRQEADVERCFDTTSRPGFWVQKRVVAEHKRQNEHRKKASRNGLMGAQVRWRGHGDPNGGPMAIDSGSSGSSWVPPGSKEPTNGSLRLIAGPSAACLQRCAARFPSLDLPVIEAKMLAYHQRNPYKNLDLAMVNWCKKAEAEGWDAKRNGTPRMTPEEWANQGEKP